ncbi:ADP-ribosylglycohydrolase family protein [Variovorax saccharolyticus]|uniref:ADP-ribosylglycohydrolase family protein n=1 Tax=Variovorax saccharolyticus TaxID=3053516 RepID=UPI002575B7D7|nr:ADP-ribosylglycohydrolase family protein [Variovorax sp. J31P216]MDM0030463.1 ADP-ribosylglycohydrolase family protein [Variovorax sp. J31P216]
MQRADAIPHERIQGAIYGALIGDAFCVPYEFHAPKDLPSKHLIEMVPPAGFRRAHGGVPPGTWSDDGALMLALLDSLTTVSPFSVEDGVNAGLGMSNARIEALNQAVAIGGNRVVWVPVAQNYGSTQANAKVYKCG